MDTTTKGNWKSSYGAQGYNTINDSLHYPSYAQVTVTGYSSPTWMESTTDIRALQKAVGPDRVAARWSANSSFTIDLNITDGQYHRIALYSLDWDGNNRSQRIDVFDWASNTLLDSKAIASFNGGQYLVWDVRGRVKITVTRTGAKTAVLSGLYFGTSLSPAPTPTPSPSPSPSPGGNNAPAVALTAPGFNSVFGTGANVSIRATASDADGSIAKVDFLKDGVVLGTATTSPYSFTWNNVPTGNYSLTAKATDNRGATSTSSAVTISVKNSPASVNRARGRGNTLISDIGSYTALGGGGDNYETSALTSDLQLLVADIQTAYADFNAERASFGANANLINTQLTAALYLSISDAALAAKVGATSNVRNQLQRLVAHLAITEDLLLYGSVSSATQTQAATAGARLDLVIGPALASYSFNGTAKLAPQSLGSIFGDALVSPLSLQTLFAPIGVGGTAPYELGGVNVTIAGKAVPVIYASPNRLSFYVSPEIAPGVVEVIVTTQDGYVSRGVTTIARNVTRLLTSNESDNGSAIALNANKESPATFDLITSQNFSPDKRTRVMFYVTGISGSAVNSDLSNDLVLDGVARQNYAESIVVLARLNAGNVISLPVEFAGKQGFLPGLDQVNVVLTSQLAGAGSVELTLLISGVRSNSVTTRVQ